MDRSARFGKTYDPVSLVIVSGQCRCRFAWREFPRPAKPPALILHCAADLGCRLRPYSGGGTSQISIPINRYFPSLLICPPFGLGRTTTLQTHTETRGFRKASLIRINFCFYQNTNSDDHHFRPKAASFGTSSVSVANIQNTFDYRRALTCGTIPLWHPAERTSFSIEVLILSLVLAC